MKRKWALVFPFALYVIGTITGCTVIKQSTPLPLLPSPTPTIIPTATQPPEARLCPSIQRGLEFLEARYNPDLGLLNEAPIAAPHVYWLTNDNVLVDYLYSQLDIDTEISRHVHSALKDYGYTTNRLIEVTWGQSIEFPPHVATAKEIAKIADDVIKHELHDGEGTFEDWVNYADLSFYGALNANIYGQSGEAKSIYEIALRKFDQIGFADQAQKSADTHAYDTFKLAMALYTGTKIGAAIPNGEKMLEILLSMQNENGGFTTGYRGNLTPEGDQNTETTAWALLAQFTYGCTPKSNSVN